MSASRDVIWFPTRLAVYERDGWRCVVCGYGPGRPERYPGLSCDHVTPRSRGGRGTPGNLVTTCVSCNSSRGVKRFSTWRPDLVTTIRNQVRRAIDRGLALTLTRKWRPLLLVKAGQRAARARAKKKGIPCVAPF